MSDLDSVYLLLCKLQRATGGDLSMAQEWIDTVDPQGNEIQGHFWVVAHRHPVQKSGYNPHVNPAPYKTKVYREQYAADPYVAIDLFLAKYEQILSEKERSAASVLASFRKEKNKVYPPQRKPASSL